MIDEPTEENAALYVLGLLEAGEREAFEARLSGDAALQALVRELRGTVAALAFAAPEAAPPAALRARLLERIGATAAKGARPGTRPRSSGAAFWLPWAAAAALALAAGWLGQDLLASRQEAESLRTTSELADLSRRDAENRREAERILLAAQLAATTRQAADLQQRLDDVGGRLDGANRRVAELARQLQAEGDLAKLRIATLVSMLDNSPQARAVAVWDPTRQQGLFTAHQLPAPGAGQDYELWVIDPARKQPVSGGIVSLDAQGNARVEFRPEDPVAQAAKFAVSRERKGGAPAHGGPQGQVVMISE